MGKIEKKVGLGQRLKIGKIEKKSQVRLEAENWKKQKKKLGQVKG